MNTHKKKKKQKEEEKQKQKSKKIENEKTYEGVQSAVLAGMAKYRSELRRDVTAEDVERLLQIKIRRISQFDIDKNRKDIADILAEEKEVADNLAHLKAFTIKYLKGLVKEYSKKYPRATRIQKGQFVQADVRKLTASELTIRWDKDAHFVGSGIRGGEELFKCSSLDRLLFVWKDGRYRMCPPEEKIFVASPIPAWPVSKRSRDSVLRGIGKGFCI